MSENWSERSEMSDVALAATLAHEIAPAGRTVGQQIAAVARKLGWSRSRTISIWYGEARRIDAREMDQLRAARDARRLQEASHEYRELRARIARLEAALAITDEAFHRPHVDALQQSMGGLRVLDRPGTGGAGE